MPYPTYEERVAFGQLPEEERNELFEKMTPEERSNISGYGTEDDPGFCDMNGYCYSHEDDAEIADSYIKENRELEEENKNLKKKNEQWEEWSRLVLLEIPGQNTIDVLIEAGLVVIDEDCACFPKLPEDSE